MASTPRPMVFDYRALRLLMGIFALTLPFASSLLSSSPLTSVSSSYHTEARDAFVGILCVVATFLWAYAGHSRLESRASKVAALAAALVAFLPTSCDGCETTVTSIAHYVAAILLFAILAFFCLVPFRKNTRRAAGKKGRRAKVYFACGWTMVACMLAIGIARLTLPSETADALRLTYWAEAIALVAFGVAWIVAGKYIPFFVDGDEALPLFHPH